MIKSLIWTTVPQPVIFFKMGCFTPASSSDDAHNRFVAKFHSLEYYISRIAKGVYKDQPVDK
jgi:hypothetical protein